MTLKTEHFLLHLFLALLVFQCQAPQTVDTVIEFAEVSKDASFSDFVKNYRIIPLEKSEEVIIQKILKVRFVQNHLFVLDGQNVMDNKLFIFDEGGQLKASIQNAGRGPGEYLQIADFDIHPINEEILIADPGNKKIMVFSFGGKHLRSFPLDHWVKNVAFLPCEKEDIGMVTGTLSSHSTSAEDNFDLFTLNPSAQLQGRFFPFTKPVDMGIGNGYNFSSFDQKVGYYRVHTDSIFRLDCNGLRLAYRLNFPKKVLPADQLIPFLTGTASPSDFVYFVNYFENSNTITCTFTSDKKNFLGVFDKQKNVSKLCELQWDESCNCKIDFAGNSDKHFMLPSDAFNVQMILDMVDPKREKCANKEILDRIKEIDEDDNPVLFLIDLGL